MKKVLFILFLLLLRVWSLPAQLNLNVTDTTVCRNTPIQVCANIPPVSLSGLNFDDRFSGTVNIGFPFVFYGQTVTQCLISEIILSLLTSGLPTANPLITPIIIL